MKILLFGKNGQVGWELQRSLLPLGEVIALDSGSKELCGDFTRLDEVARSRSDCAPDVIVNAAAYTAVDKAESEPEHRSDHQRAGARRCASKPQSVGALLVHYSTDYVFDGSGDRPREETDPAGPLNVYGTPSWKARQPSSTPVAAI